MKKFLIRYLRRCARMRMKRKKPYVIGITGSIGKTSCRMIVTGLLQQLLPQMHIRTSQKNFNTEIGLALSILDISNSPETRRATFLICVRAGRKALFEAQEVDVLVLEYGIDAPGDMDRLVSVCQPHAGILTGLDLVHAHQLLGPDEILSEKVKLLLAAKEVVFYPFHLHHTVCDYLPQIAGDVLSFASQQEDIDGADIRRNNRQYVVQPNNKLPRVCFDLIQGVDRVVRIETNLLGKESAGYCSLAVELAMILSRRLGANELLDLETVRFESKLQAGRFAVYQGRRGSLLVDSTYNAAPKSMETTIQNVIRLRNELYKDFDLVYCLGDMRELGEFEEQEHRKLARLVSQSADAVYVVGPAMQIYLLDELEKLGFNMHDVTLCATSKILGEQLTHDLPKRSRRSLVLLKGSQNTIFLEEALPFLVDTSFDTQNLPRQSSQWKKKKAQYFASVS